uniref:Cilia- and flagella-associated protein HOATZ n=1 Tax=Pseudonaja textilis TaxID=8673 RepID=A0A670Y9Z9_PSETE
MASSSPPAPATSPSPSAAAAAPAPLAFAGSSEQDVALAKSFWNSVTLQPPLESRLGARGSSLCNGASCPRRSSAGSPRKSRNVLSFALAASKPAFIFVAINNPLMDLIPGPSIRPGSEKWGYLEKGVYSSNSAPIHPPPPHRGKHLSLQAKTREDIIALLKKQREERISVRWIFKLSKPPSPENQALLPCLTFLSHFFPTASFSM